MTTNDEGRGVAPAQAVAQAGVHLPRLVHMCLRGRYPIAIALGLALALPLGYIGWRATKPYYMSEGVVHIAPVRQVVIYQTEFNSPMAYFDAYVQNEATRLSSGEVFRPAIDDPDLRDLAWPEGDAGVKALERIIHVMPPRRTDIDVQAWHPDPRVAYAAVNAVIRSYERLHSSEQQAQVAEIKQVIEERIANLEAQLADLRAESARLYDLHGSPDSLQRQLQGLDEQLLKTTEQIAGAEIEINQLRERIASIPEPGSIDLQSLPLELVGSGDQRYLDLVGLEKSISSQMELYSKRGVTRKHPEMVRLEQQLRDVRVMIEERGAVLRELYVARKAQEIADATQRERELELKRDGLREFGRELSAQIQELGAKLQPLSEINEQITQAEKRKRESEDRLDQLRVEIASGQGDEGRAEVSRFGTFPDEPASDKRRFLAVAGAGMGFGMGVGSMVLLGLVTRRFRYIDELDGSALGVPLLGVVPRISARTGKQGELAALSVHHIRNMLEAKLPRDDQSGIIWAVTSSRPGDGKTSLALSLANSLAASGRRTLVVDADMIGRHLSRELGLIHVDGFAEAVGGPAEEARVYRTQHQNLWAMSAGSAAHCAPERTSASSMRRLFSELASEFDRVIVDTGPLLGSLEGNLACMAASGVVLVVSRGRSPRVVESTLARMRTIGATCVGVVFNRAAAGDVRRSVSAASIVLSEPPEFSGRPGKRGRGDRAIFMGESDRWSLARQRESNES